MEYNTYFAFYRSLSLDYITSVLGKHGLTWKQWESPELSLQYGERLIQLNLDKILYHALKPLESADDLDDYWLCARRVVYHCEFILDVLPAVLEKDQGRMELTSHRYGIPLSVLE